MSNVIELAGVSKGYWRGSERIAALRNVSLEVAHGEFLAVVGPSGSGKTTLLYLMGCMDRPDEGAVRIAGREINGLRERQLTRLRGRTVGFVFQQFFLLPTLTARENVQLPAVFLRAGDRAERAAELLERVGLGGRAKHLPGQLSGGEMQRVAIARALINEPKVLLADEPTGNLDSHNAETIMQIFAELNRQGLTVVVVTHNSDLARRAHRVVRLKDGEICDPGTGP